LRRKWRNEQRIQTFLMQRNVAVVKRNFRFLSYRFNWERKSASPLFHSTYLLIYIFKSAMLGRSAVNRVLFVCCLPPCTAPWVTKGKAAIADIFLFFFKSYDLTKALSSAAFIHTVVSWWNSSFSQFVCNTELFTFQIARCEFPPFSLASLALIGIIKKAPDSLHSSSFCKTLHLVFNWISQSCLKQVLYRQWWREIIENTNLGEDWKEVINNASAKRNVIIVFRFLSFFTFCKEHCHAPMSYISQ